MTDPLKLARECFLSMIAEARRFEEEADEGRLDYHLMIRNDDLCNLCTALGIHVRLMESAKDAIDRELEG